MVFLFSSLVFISILKLAQYVFVCHNQLLEFVWCGTRGDIFGTCGDLVVVFKANLVLALVQTRILDLDSDQAEQLYCYKIILFSELLMR